MPKGSIVVVNTWYVHRNLIILLDFSCLNSNIGLFFMILVFHLAFIARSDTYSNAIVEYPEPFRFNPGRFLKDGRLNLAVKDPATAAFGYGRRVCPG